MEDAAFTITGPTSLNLGVTGVWTITATVYDLYSELALDVLAPLHNTGVMTIDKIAVIAVGKWSHSCGVSIFPSEVVFQFVEKISTLANYSRKESTHRFCVQRIYILVNT